MPVMMILCRSSCRQVRLSVWNTMSWWCFLVGVVLARSTGAWMTSILRKKNAGGISSSVGPTPSFQGIASATQQLNDLHWRQQPNSPATSLLHQRPIDRRQSLSSSSSSSHDADFAFESSASIGLDNTADELGNVNAVPTSILKELVGSVQGENDGNGIESTSSSNQSNNMVVRAGADGYSVKRQPASRARWDPRADPTFAVPQSMDPRQDTNGFHEDYLYDWRLGTERNTGNSNAQKQFISSSGTKPADRLTLGRAERPNKVSTPSDASIDLWQRTLDTLDVPRVWRALYNQCTTVQAQQIVQHATSAAAAPMNHSSSLQEQQQKQQQQQQQQPRVDDKNTSGRIRKRLLLSCQHISREALERAFQPLLAETVSGAQERYGAVQELQWLLLDGMGDGGRQQRNGDRRNNPIAPNTYMYKDHRFQKQSVLGRPAPLGNNDFVFIPALQQMEEEGLVLDGEDILKVLDILHTFQNIQQWSATLQAIEEYEFVLLPELAQAVTVNTTLVDLLSTALDKDGRLNGGTFTKLGQMRARVRTIKAQLLQTLEQVLALPSIRSKLQQQQMDGGINTPLISEVAGSGRLVIPVQPQFAASIGIVHDTSRSGKTAFVEPTEIVELSNTLQQAEHDLQREEERIWRMLTQKVVTYNLGAMQVAAAAAGQLDLVHAKLLLAQNWDQQSSHSGAYGVIPLVQDEGVICLQNAKHPVLLLRGLPNVVGNDLNLGQNGNQGLILTGPNAGGKTVILKLMGLVALMARAGVPLPAEQESFHDEEYDEHGNSQHRRYRPRVDFFHPVLADIGDLQSVGGDLSTFSGHLLVCKQVLEQSRRSALVLMDELGSGTDPAQGVALAQALLEAVVETGARVAITTHYQPLKQLAATDNRFAVAGMQFVQGRPTYKLLQGAVGESFALAVAERLRLPPAVIARATELLDSETRQMGDLIRELEDQKASLDQQAVEMETQRKEMAAIEFRMREEQLRLEKKQVTVRREEARKFAQKLEEKERILDEVLEKLKQDPSRRVIAKSWQDIRFVKRDVLNEAENTPSVMARKQKNAAQQEQVSAELVPISDMQERPALQAGDLVVVCKQGPLLGREAEILQLSGNRVDIRVNNMNMALKLSDIALPTYGVSPNYESSGQSKRSVGLNSIRKAAQRAIAVEQASSGGSIPTAVVDASSSRSSNRVAMRTQSNTVDVRGCNLEEAKEKIRGKFSASLLSNRPVVFVLHGHGTSNVLKTKLRSWLQKEVNSAPSAGRESVVKNFGPADASDGGDAFTRVELR